MLVHQIGISRIDMSCAQAHWVGSKSIGRIMQLKLHKPTIAIGYSLQICAQHVDSTNPGPINVVFRTKKRYQKPRCRIGSLSSTLPARGITTSPATEMT